MYESVFEKLQDSLVSIFVVLTLENSFEARVHQDISSLHDSLVSDLLDRD